MKKSEFKALVKEAMMEILPDLMEIMVEGMMNESTSYVPQSGQQRPDLSLIRKTYGQRSGAGYSDMPDAPRASRTVPANPKTIIDGEQFASGKGIMEWFESAGPAPISTTEFNHSAEDMDSYMSLKFGTE